MGMRSLFPLVLAIVFSANGKIKESTNSQEKEQDSLGKNFVKATLHARVFYMYVVVLKNRLIFTEL